MASIRKRGSKWQVQVRRHGYPPFCKTFHEKTDALRWARQTETDLDKGVIPRANLRQDLTTVGDVLKHFLKNAKTRRGTACRNPAVTGWTRCRMHGARGGAPKGDRNGNYRNGTYTKERIAKQTPTGP
jgi:hypothetical protein